MWGHVFENVAGPGGQRCERIEDYGFGKGYAHAMQYWRQLRDSLNEITARGIMVCSIAHSAVVRVEPPDLDGYDKYQTRLNKHADAMWSHWHDAVLFANYKVTTISAGPSKKPGETRKRGHGSGERILHTVDRPAWFAKNRYKMPDTLPMDWAAVEPFLVGQTND